LQNGAKQLVILGAGFDTRPYRFAELVKDKKVFEVDYASTQEIKKRRLAAASIPIPPNVNFVEIDFKKQSLRDVLSAAGYDASQKAFFIWEGVSMYLAEQAVRETLRAISSYAASGSGLGHGFCRAGDGSFTETSFLNCRSTTTRHIGVNRGSSAYPDMRESEFFSECGLQLREILSIMSRESSKRYLTRSDGRSFGSVRGGPPERDRFAAIAKLMWTFFTTKSRWYAVAKLDIP
jgi:methyltransferase (TIGR00027 family)